MALVHVKPARERDGRSAAKRTSHEHARMAEHRGNGEAGDIGIADAPNVFEAIGKPGQPRAKYEARYGLLRANAPADRRGRVGGSLLSIRAVRASAHVVPPRRAAMSARAVATRASRSAGDTNAL